MNIQIFILKAKTKKQKEKKPTTVRYVQQPNITKIYSKKPKKKKKSLNLNTENVKLEKIQYVSLFCHQNFNNIKL